MNITNYVAGFIFGLQDYEIALIRKNKPAWQKGLLNGIGGKIEQGETAYEAMVREFQEETGVPTDQTDWRHFALLKGPQFTVDFFATRGDLKLLRSNEEEQIEFIRVTDIDPMRHDMIENLPWLISLAKDHLDDGRPRFTTAEYP